MLGFLRTGRLGEWRADWGLDELVDIYEIYSNIGVDPLAAVIVDAYSGRTIAQTGQYARERRDVFDGRAGAGGCVALPLQVGRTRPCRGLACR